MNCRHDAVSGNDACFPLNIMFLGVIDAFHVVLARIFCAERLEFDIVVRIFIAFSFHGCVLHRVQSYSAIEGSQIVQKFANYDTRFNCRL